MTNHCLPDQRFTYLFGDDKFEVITAKERRALATSILFTLRADMYTHPTCTSDKQFIKTHNVMTYMSIFLRMCYGQSSCKVLFISIIAENESNSGI